MTPLRILLFLAICFGIMGLIALVFPEKGITLGNGVTIKYPALASIFQSDTTTKADISNIVKMEVVEDTAVAEEVRVIDSSKYHGLVKLDTGITYIPLEYTDAKVLDAFFQSLVIANADGPTCRIMHYGDSQIEVDRITGYLRSRLQGQFGGSGPGLLNIMPVAEAGAYKNTFSEGWDRYTAFTKKDARVKHRAYGPLAAFSRYCPYPDSIQPTPPEKNAWLQVLNTKKGNARLAKYSVANLYYGNCTEKTQVTVTADDVVVYQDSLQLGGTGNAVHIEFAQTPTKLHYAFSGKGSPDIYGVSLEGYGGVIIDNLALRGSSGDFFSSLDQTQLRNFYNSVHVNLFILQFGGNTIPYLKDANHAASYARSIGTQIRLLKGMRPDASVIFIGPSDMSIKEGTDYITHPLLESLNNSLKEEAIKAGAAYFDMFTAMGGKNSMVAWVDAGLATLDYIHFSPDGARKIAVLLYQSIMQEYNNYIIRNTH